jgi:hypothetical protein
MTNSALEMFTNLTADTKTIGTKSWSSSQKSLAEEGRVYYILIQVYGDERNFNIVVQNIYISTLFLRLMFNN